MSRESFIIRYPDSDAGKKAWNKAYGLNAIYAGKHWSKRRDDARLDCSNHAYMAKLIEDGMKGILLHDDSRRWVKGIEHYFHDKPYIRVTITEVEP